MNDTHKNLRAYLAAQSPIVAIVGDSIHANMVPEDSERPYIWFRRRSADWDECTNERDNVPMLETFVLEMHSDDQGTLYADGGLVEVVVDALQKVTDTLGNQPVNWVHVVDADDDHILLPNQSPGVFLESIDVEIENTIGV